MKTDDFYYQFYENLTEPVKTISIFVYDYTLISADNSDLFIAYLSVIGLFVNFFHIFILSRKSMRQSSINVLMIGQSISDIICFFYNTSDIPVVWDFLNNDNECDPPASYFWVLGELTYYHLNNICRRVSPWIGVVMAAFRLLISSFPLNNTIGKLGKPIFSLCSFLILSVISTALAAPFYEQRTVKSTEQWVPAESCGYPANYSLAIHTIEEKYDYHLNRAVFDIFHYWTAIFANSPSLLLPFITIGLIRVLKKHEENRAHLSGSSKEATRYNTTKLVTIMTVCLIVTEASYRVSDTLIMYLDDFAATLIAMNFNLSSRIFFPLNSIAHCFINMLLSSEYRKCIRQSFICFNVGGPEQGISQSRNSGSNAATARMT